MGLINKTCECCKKEFLADTREHNRGYAKYCSSSCAGKHQNKNKAKKEFICQFCDCIFFSYSLAPKYCSNMCKQRNYRFNSKDEFSIKTLTRVLKQLPCEICGWNEASCDLHHIQPVSKGGRTSLDNLIKVCPNHHRMIHFNLISQDYLLKVVQFRTISSSSSEEQDAISGN